MALLPHWHLLTPSVRLWPNKAVSANVVACERVDFLFGTLVIFLEKLLKYKHTQV